MIFDTHSHYDDRAFDEDRERLLLSLEKNGIGNIVCVGADMKSSKAAMELAHRYDFAYAAVGVHPSDTAPLTESDMERLEHASHDEKVVAIGEIGLDYHWEEPEPDIQRKWFRRQIELAKNVNLPIIYHSREAAKDTMDIILETHAADCGGVIHCYSYAKEMAKEYVDMGFYIGVGGVITFKNGRRLKETVEAIPLSHIVLETDCPYLSPEPNRGRRNDSTNLIYVAREIAAIKGISEQEVIEETEKNARKLYRLDEKNRR